MLNTGFAGLLCLGEMAISNNLHARDFRKVVLSNLLKIYSQLEQENLSLRYEDDVLSNVLRGTGKLWH